MDGDIPKQPRPRQNLNTEIPASVSPFTAVEGFVEKTASNFAKGMDDSISMSRTSLGPHPDAESNVRAVEKVIVDAASKFVGGMEEAKAAMGRKFFNAGPKTGR
jgi:hypothetical protein